MPTFIYGLYYFEDKNTKKYFYVGQSREPQRRFKQHEYTSKKGHEDKYHKIRELQCDGLEWRWDILAEIPPEKFIRDCERFWVIQLTRQNHDLTNMRHGTAEERRTLTADVNDPEIRTLDDVRKVREERERRKYEKSEELRNRILLEEARAAIGKGICYVDHPDISPLLRTRLENAGLNGIQRVTLSFKPSDRDHNAAGIKKALLTPLQFAAEIEMLRKRFPSR
jgi:hypothetical protein